MAIFSYPPPTRPWPPPARPRCWARCSPWSPPRWSWRSSPPSSARVGSYPYARGRLGGWPQAPRRPAAPV